MLKLPADRTPEQSKAFAQKWRLRIEDALRREKDYRKIGKECVDLYEAKDPSSVPFNILYSNTEVLGPSVYNARPIPIVTRRFKDPDPVGKAAAEVSTRLLKFLIEAESEDCDNFDELTFSAVLDTLVTNRGLTLFKYEGKGAYAEAVYGESVRWDKFIHGYARSWKKVPWIGLEWDMSREEVEKNFPEIAHKVDFRKLVQEPSEDDKTSETREQLTGVKLARVYQIWDKTSKKVLFFCDAYQDGPLKEVDDPLELANFYPVPKPLNFMRKITTLTPTPLYQQYRQQAQELNDITRRLKAMIKALKIRGFYNSTVEGIEKVLEAEDNTLVPVENPSMPDGTGVDKMIYFMPVDMLANTVLSLHQQRDRVKQVIYEITGISDILRGASQASETATAQQLKNQWGSLRLKKLQKEVQRFCRDSLRIILEIAVTKFDTETIAQMTGLPFLTKETKDAIEAQIQMVHQSAQDTGQAPEPVPEAVQKALQLPTWDEILGLLRNDKLRGYKVDIETNSTIDAEAAQDKQDIAELLNSLSQFLNGIAPLMEKGVMPFDVAKAMLLTISRRFTFGTELEESLNLMKPPEPPAADPNLQAKQASDAAKLKADEAKSLADQQKASQDQQLSRQEFQQKKELMVLQGQIAQEELAIKQAELALQKAGLAMKAELQKQTHEQKLELMTAKAVQEKSETKKESV
jgi:hypothetical protein